MTTPPESMTSRRRVACAGAVSLLRWIALGAASGVLAGLASAAFIEALDAATDIRLDHPWLVVALPVAGLVIGVVYHRWGSRAVEGNALLLDEIHEPTAWVPRRMAPLVFAGTVASHLFGASVGREGAALQMSGSLSDAIARVLHLSGRERRLLLIAAMAGGFGAVFGVPLAGAIFGLEVQSIGRVRFRALVPAVTASFVGDAVVRALGVHHAARPQLDPNLDAGLLVKIAIAGVAFGLVASAFTAVTHIVRRVMPRVVPWFPARLAVGGLATVLLAALVGRDYLGLSLPLIDRTLAGHQPEFTVFALKLVFTAIALGCGFPGGEVTPLFVIGTTLGGALAGPLHVDVTLLAAIGFVAVFAGAANTPIACTVMGAELFGAGAIVVLAVGCLIAFACSDPHGIYTSHRAGDRAPARRGMGTPPAVAWVRRRR
jgi:H+/Cl- antiporter ClcA